MIEDKTFIASDSYETITITVDFVYCASKLASLNDPIEFGLLA